jgi:hypothetical protein
MLDPITPMLSPGIGGGIDEIAGEDEGVESHGPKGDPGGGPRGEVVAE